jgi:hypothetical protein
MRAEADRCRDNDVEAISRPGQVLHRGLQLPGLSFKVRHDVEVVVAAEHGKPVLQCEGRAGSRTHSLHSRAIAAKYELEFLRVNKQYPIFRRIRTLVRTCSSTPYAFVPAFHP